MRNTTAIIFVALFSLVFSAFTPADAAFKFGNWVRVGSKKVDFKIDRDVLHVGPSKGKFDRLKLQVTGGDLNMRKMVIEYGNGEKETINLKQKFKAGTGSRIVDLNGGKRVIKDITFWYDTRNNANRKAVLHVLGNH